MQFELLSLLVVLLAGVVTAKDAPVGKCKHPIPGYPHLKISELDDQEFQYLYTPSSVLFKAVDSLAMKINKIEGQEGVYTQTIKGKTFIGGKKNMKFKVKDLGDGKLEKIVKEGELSYIASIVDIKDNVALLYVCSETGVDHMFDQLYVIAKKAVNHEDVQHPGEYFKDSFEKFQFNTKLRKLPQKYAHKIKF